MAGIRAAEAAGSLAAGHLALSGLGIANACLARSSVPAASEGPQPAAVAQRLVSEVYRGDGLSPELVTSDVTFTDPAARCVGVLEVTEAFRALRFCRPEPLAEPLHETKVDGTVHFHLHQRYFAGSTLLKGGLEVRSTLVVRLAPDGRVSTLEERWNDEPLLSWAPFRWVRRVNGILSATLTPLLR